MPKSKKRHVNGGLPSEATPTLSPITPDRQNWPGWCEVESEPAFFNTILRDMGIRGVKVQEVLGLDDDLLAILPKPVHAMIFLSRYRGDGEESQHTSCPTNVWFANQVPEYACATVAMLNIVMNLPGLELGSELQQFKDFTTPQDPVSKGDAIASFDFVRSIHNSFARDNDMLNVDSQLKGKHSQLLKKQKLEAQTTARAAKAAEKAARDAEKEAKKAANAKPGSRSNPSRNARSTKMKEGPEIPEEEGFHFVAFMPIDGEVWKLDGMDRFPKLLGTFDQDQDWLNIARTELLARMLQYQEGQIEFSLMAVIKDPVVEDRSRLADNIKSLLKVNQRLDETSPGWRSFEAVDSDDATIQGHSTDYQICEYDINNAKIPQSMVEKMKTSDPQILMQIRQDIITGQAGCRAAMRDQIQSDKADAIEALHRRFDYSPFINGWLDALATEDALVPLLELSKT